MDFATTTLATWDEIRSHIKHESLFRGQQQDWPLRTSFERCCDKMTWSWKDRHTLEERLLREFRRAYHHYGLHIPNSYATLEWLALMQHYGGPTRLLDFTYSIFVAAYFAVENAEDTSVVWRIDRQWASKTSIARLKAAGKTAASALAKPYNDDLSDKTFHKNLFSGRQALCACPQTPFRLNERLRIQMGVFLVTGDVRRPFEDNLRTLPGYDKSANVLKIYIPHSMRQEALAELFDMGISHRTLFPGLDGYARSLGVYCPAFRPIP